MARRRRTRAKSMGPAQSEQAGVPPTRLRRALPVIFLFVIVSVAYLNADHEDFIFDSRLLLIDASQENQGIIQAVKGLWQGRYNPDAPLTFLTFSLNYTFNTALGLEGFDITTFLIFNVIIHGLNACLVYFLVRALLGLLEPDGRPAVFIPLVLATLFAVHPIHASSVAYINQRRGALATTFYLLAIIAYLRVRKSPQPPQQQPAAGRSEARPAYKRTFSRPWRRIALAATIPVLYWLSFRSKNLGLTLPLAILAMEFCFRAPDRRALRRYLALLVPGIVVCFVGMFVFLWRRGLFDPATMALHHFGPETFWGPWPHFLTEARVFVHYWKLLLLPLPMWSCIDHGFSLSTHLFDHGAIAAIVFHGLLLILAVAAAFRRYTLAAIGFFWFYVVLIPYAVLPQLELFVEYKTYLPSVGVALIFAEGLRRIRRRIPFKVLASTAAAIAALLLITTVHRNRIYQSSYNAWADAVSKSPGHARPHVNFGNALVRQKRFDEAMAQYQEAVRVEPDFPVSHNQLGNILIMRDRTDEAIEHFTRAIQLRPDYTDPYNNLAIALAKQGKLDQAQERLHQLLELDPDYPNVHRFLGDLLSQQKKTDEAIEEYRKALQQDEKDAKARQRLETLLAGKRGGNQQ